MAIPEQTKSRPNHVAIWGVLVLLLVAGIAAGSVGHVLLSTVLVFSVAGVKALLVAANFMHLRVEPRFVSVVLLGALACVAVLVLALIPDIMYGYGR